MHGNCDTFGIAQVKLRKIAVVSVASRRRPGLSVQQQCAAGTAATTDMKQLHRPDLFAWSAFDEQRNIDFHSYLRVRADGSLLVDPLPLSEHDRAHLQQLGPAKYVLFTNSDHLRDGNAIATELGAVTIGPFAERDAFPFSCNQWVEEGDEPLPGLLVLELEGSKTPGELCLLLEQTTLITGDLIRSHQGGTLHLLPDKKLRDKYRAQESVRRLLDHPEIEAVLPGDGWPIFRGGHQAITDMVAAFR